MSMKWRTLTLVIDEDLLREARAVAERQRTSVDQMVREYLQQVVNRESRRRVALESIRPLLDRPPVHLGRPRLSRDKLHER